MRLNISASKNFLAIAALMLHIGGCGKNEGSSKGGGRPQSGVQGAFSLAANESKIPERFLIAIAFHESNLSPEESSVPYFQAEGSAQQHSLGFNMTETAFGLSRKELAVKAGKDGNTLEVQIPAYAAWLSKKMKDLKGFSLKDNPVTLDERFDWLWAIGTIHVPNDRNIRAMWVKGVMNVLNEGRVWQDHRNGQILELAPEADKYDEDRLAPQSRNLLNFDDDISDINAARRIELVTDSSSTLENTPRRVEVIHCPLSLASCLKLQESSSSSDVRIGAHYIIPQDNKIIPRPIQILDHERRVQMTSADGTIKDVKDAVVIMLVGNSGRYINGDRMNADPTWFTSWQLRRLGATIKGVCSYLAQRDSNVNVNRCTATEGDEGVYFHHQATRPTYRWGDIPDFDKSIFLAYLESSDANIQGDVTLELPGDQKKYQAGADIDLRARFSNGTRWLRLQRAVRCDDKQLVWDTLRTEPLVGRTEAPLKISIMDAGPNQNGHQFLRVLVYDERNRLLGWSIKDFYLEKYDEKFSPPSEACFLRE